VQEGEKWGVWDLDKKRSGLEKRRGFEDRRGEGKRKKRNVGDWRVSAN